MKRPLTAALVVLLVTAGASGPVAAQEQSERTETLDELVERYNANVEEVPTPIRERFAGERVEVVVDSANGTRYYHATLSDDARVEAYDAGRAADPTVRVTTDRETLREIRTAGDPADRAMTAYEDGEIEVEGVGTLKSVEVGAVETAVAVGRALGLL